MAFENKIVSALFDDVYKHRRAATTYRMYARLIADGEEINVAEIVNRQITRDYINAYHDVTILKIQVPITQYSNTIYPNKTKLTCEIKFEMAGPKGERLKSPDIWIRKYKVILADPIDPRYVKSDKRPVEGSQKALSALLTLNLQLVDKIAYDMQFVRLGGIYKCNPEDLIKTHLSYKLDKKESRSALVSTDFEDVRGVDVVPCDNTATKYMYIQSGTRMVDLPQYLQSQFGVYNTDIGYYYQTNYTISDKYQSVKGGWWFVYPIYNFKRFNSSPRTLTVFLMPESELVDSEKTFTYFDKQLFLFTTGSAGNADYSEYEFFNNGNGISFSRSEELLDTMYRTEDNRTYPDIEQTRRTLAVTKRDDKINDIRPVSGLYTENPYKHVTRLSKANCTPLAVNWTNAMPDLLIPGMPAKIMHLGDNGIEEVDAVLVKVTTIEKKQRNSLIEDPFTTSCTLSFLVDKNA